MGRETQGVFFYQQAFSTGFYCTSHLGFECAGAIRKEME